MLDLRLFYDRNKKMLSAFISNLFYILICFPIAALWYVVQLMIRKKIYYTFWANQSLNIKINSTIRKSIDIYLLKGSVVASGDIKVFSLQCNILLINYKDDMLSNY